MKGAENVHAPFFSPDGAWVGFEDGQREIKRISVEGGKSWTICMRRDTLSVRPGGPMGQSSTATGMNFGLFRVPWDGGEPQRLTDRGPGRRGVLST